MPTSPVARGFLLSVVLAGSVSSFVNVASVGAAAPQTGFAAPTQKTCQLRSNNTWARGTTQTLSDCAVNIAAAGAQAGRSEVRGRWGQQEFVVQSSGKVYWAADNRLAGRVPDLDQDAIRYDACPREAETANNVFDADGCPDDLTDLMDLVEKDLNAFWAQNVTDYEPPTTITPYTRRAPVRTACGRSIPNNAFYCGADGGIYYDYNFLNGFLRDGDFGPVVVLAHEWGHFMQDQLGIRNRYSIDQELQADCFAGSYARYLASGKSTLARMEEGDAEEGANLIYRLGDPNGTPWNDPDAHGTADQRAAAFALGLDEGVQACIDM